MFSRAIFHFRSHQDSIIELVWWVEAIFWKKPEVKADFTMVGTPKPCVVNDFRPRVKTSLWPFCKWILTPTKAILAPFVFQICQRAPYFASSCGWHDTYKKHYKIGMGRTPLRRYAQISQNSYPARTKKQWIRQTCSNLTCRGRNENHFQPALSIGLYVF